jgi:hypothetical protein
MITSEQFDEALKIIIDYKTQIESKNINSKLDITFVDIQKNISTNTFFVLQTYFKENFNEHIDWNSLKKMDLDKLERIDLSILRMYRGFGKISEDNLKKLIHSLRKNQNDFN